MTNHSSTPRRYGALVSLVGEYLAVAHIQELGWRVDRDEMFGGQRRHYDLRAVSPRGEVAQVSVKTSTRAGGGLVWQRPGTETVAPWIAQAATAGERAVVLGMHVAPAGPVQQVEGGFFFPTPDVLAIGALPADAWGRSVDVARAAYGAMPRKDGRGMLTASGLRYPLTVDELDWLENVLEPSPTDQ